jgi:CRISPR-associated protein Cmr1
MENIKVTFETITPLWTGDAWGNNTEIRPSSIMGSLRFWFEVICYFAGITTDNDYEEGKLKVDITSKQLQEKFLELFKNNLDKDHNELIDITLAELGVPLPARIFGCTGWESLIRIKEIKIIKNNKDNYNYPVGKIKFDELEYKNSRGNIIIPAWYFNKGFLGPFEITFEIKNKSISNNILYPLLNFIQKYGYLGGKWNLGYGRFKVEKVEENRQKKDDWENQYFKFSKFYKDKDNKFTDIELNTLCVNSRSWDDLEDKSKKQIMYLKKENTHENVSVIIKSLLKEKAIHRKDTSNYSERHYVFGIGGKNTEGTKIIPWIYKENSQLKGGFISIVGLIDLGDENE